MGLFNKKDSNGVPSGCRIFCNINFYENRDKKSFGCAKTLFCVDPQRLPDLDPALNIGMSLMVERFIAQDYPALRNLTNEEILELRAKAATYQDAKDPFPWLHALRDVNQNRSTSQITYTSI